MKTIKNILIILILFFSCYYIYSKTENSKLNYLTFGDFLSKGINSYGITTYGYNECPLEYLKKENVLNKFDNSFADSDYRIIDIIKMLEYNERKNYSSLGILIKNADIITISLGTNEIYYKLEKDSYKIYSYIDNMLYNYNKILNYINKFPHKKVFIIGYYNNLNKFDDVFDYANSKLKLLCKKYNYDFIDISNELSNNPLYFDKKDNLIPNKEGYYKISQKIVAKIKNN